MQKAINPTKVFKIASFIIAGLLVIGAASCHAPEDCGAYNGSKKSNSRSYKTKHHRHAMVISSGATKLA